MKARKKGNNYELAVAKLFWELGWDCVSSRSESKNTDDAGIDLCYTDPFQVQCKATQRTPAYHKLLAEMPAKQGMCNLIFHKRDRQGTVVVMTQESFKAILETLIETRTVNPPNPPRKKEKNEKETD